MGVKSTVKAAIPASAREWGFAAVGAGLGGLVVKFGPKVYGKAAGWIHSMRSKKTKTKTTKAA